jgi:hypothetical protein
LVECSQLWECGMDFLPPHFGARARAEYTVSGTVLGVLF